jgi:hypothetical protein
MIHPMRFARLFRRVTLITSLAFFAPQPARACSPNGSEPADCSGGLIFIMGGMSLVLASMITAPPVGILAYSREHRPLEQPNRAAAIVAIVGGTLTVLPAAIWFSAFAMGPEAGAIGAVMGVASLSLSGVAWWLGADGIAGADAWDASHPAPPPGPTVDSPPATSFKLPPPKVSLAPVVSAQQQGLALVIAGW